MLIDNLFCRVLEAPAEEQGVDRLRIVSGFATANMADRHMERLSEIGCPISIELIIGMPLRDGIERAQHYALRRLAREFRYGMNFSCHYVTEGPPVHAKTYCWFRGDEPVMAFMGSANYTCTGFNLLQAQIETMISADARFVADFQTDIQRSADNCLSEGIDNQINIVESRRITDMGRNREGEANRNMDMNRGVDENENVIHLSLLSSRGNETPEISGINWGQRPDRNKNQSYINIPADIGRSGFFPDRPIPFTVLTDDGNVFIMVRAQDDGKGLQTTHNNALLGAYLRDRMRVPSGEYVTRQHLERYGRTDITFIKIDNETYLLDFRPNIL